jgi:hypothetical protein
MKYSYSVLMMYTMTLKSVVDKLPNSIRDNLETLHLTDLLSITSHPEIELTALGQMTALKKIVIKTRGVCYKTEAIRMKGYIGYYAGLDVDVVVMSGAITYTLLE